jgi:hypothetical protein
MFDERRARRNFRLALTTFLIALISFLFEDLVIASYIYLIHTTKDVIAEFGWGHVPASRLSAFLWLSHNLRTLLLVGINVGGLATLFLFYFTARAVPCLGVKQNFRPWLTALSVLIPFYSIYRPWAGLGEVRNTLTEARRAQRLPASGIQGTNEATVVYAITLLGCGVVDYALAIYALQLNTTYAGMHGPDQFNNYLNAMIGLNLVHFTSLTISLVVATWYWWGMLALLRAALSLPASEAPADRSGDLEASIA